ALPIFNRLAHSGIAWESEDAMQMIRHEQHDAAMPSEMFVVVSRRRQNGVSWSGLGETVPPTRFAVDGDEKETSFFDPLRNRVREFLPNRKIHEPRFYKEHIALEARRCDSQRKKFTSIGIRVGQRCPQRAANLRR